MGFLPERLDVAEVGRALQDVVHRLSQRLAGEAGPLTFYAWYDEQAGHLRCSLARVPTTDLPFGGPYRPVDEPEQVLARMAADQHPGFIPWSDLQEVPLTSEGSTTGDPAADAPGPGTDYWFPVYAASVHGQPRSLAEPRFGPEGLNAG